MAKTPKTPKTPYEILGVDTDSTSDQIKSAYRTLAKDTHPDSNGGVDGGFQAIKKAYEVLSDPKRRKVYDRLNNIVQNSTPSIPQNPFQQFAQAGQSSAQAMMNFWNTMGAQYVYGNSVGAQSMVGSSGSVQYTYTQKQQPRQAIMIPRILIRALRETMSMPSPSALGYYTYNTVRTVETVIDMRGVPWFGPNDVLRLEYDYAGGHGYVDIRVIKVSFTGNSQVYSEAEVIGEQI